MPRAVGLLNTKLQPPPLSAGIIDRKRVGDAVAAEPAPFLLIVAGPGYGKTIAARQAIGSLEVPVGWVSLDAIDDTSTGFWSYVIESLRRAVGVGDEAATMVADETSPTSFLTSLLGDLAACPSSVAVVLDDLHVIKSVPVLSELEYFIERLPGNARVIATSRVDPPLPLSRWRLRGRLGDIRQDALRFSLDEADQLVRSTADIDLGNDELATIVERTEGWAAGLQLTLLSLRGLDDVHGFLRDAFPSDRMIADYLVSEVLDRLPAEERQLLLELSVLADFDSDLAMFVTEQPDAGHRIRSLEAAGLLLLPVDEDRQRLRFHQLLRELLEQELRWREPDRVATLHGRAGDYLAKTDHPRQAVQHYIAAGRLDEAFDLVIDSTLSLLDTGDGASTRRWLDQFPTEFVAGSVHRMLGYAAMLIVSGRPDDAVAWLDRVNGAGTDAVHRQQVESAAQRTVLQMWQADCGRAEQSAEVFLGMHSDAPFRPPVVDRMPAILTRLALYAGDLDRAEHWLRVACSAPGDDVVAQLLPLALQGEAALARGALDEAERYATAAVTWADGRDIGNAPAVGEAHGVLARVKLETGDLATAETEVRLAVEVMADLRITLFEVRQRMLGVRIATARFGTTAGRELLEVSRRALEGRYVGETGQAMLAAAEADLLLRDGDTEAAAPLVETLPADRTTALLRARVLQLEGRFADAARVLHDVREWPIPEQIDGLLVLARCVPGQEAGPLVRDAAVLAVPRGFVRPFFASGPEIKRLLRAARKASPTPELDQLLELAASTESSAAREPVATFAAALTDREQDLLRLLPTHLTYREMANELCVSINTLKSYQKALFRKLQVPSRSEAVAAGRQAGLIAS